MDDHPFEERFEARVRVFATSGVRSVDSASVAREVAAAHPRGSTVPALRRFGGRPQPARTRAVLAAAAVVTVLAAGGSLLVLSRGGLDPTPSAPPSPSLPGVVAPSSTPAATLPRPAASPRTTATWITTGTMGTARHDFTAVRLFDGRVLVVGGANSDETDTTAELYDPATGIWTQTGSMLEPRAGFPATLLRDGKVLVGGVDAGAEVYDPGTGTWTPTGKRISGGGSTATLLRDGRVLVIGYGDTGELYDPERGTWSATGRITTPRHSHAAVLLADGKVLVVGGHAPGDLPTDSAELFDPTTETWTAIASMHAPRDLLTGVLQPDGTVLVLGSSRSEPQSMELYDPARGTWTNVGESARPAPSHVFATWLGDGRVLLTGFDETAQLYDPATGSWTSVAPMLRSHAGPGILLLDGTVLMAGGRDCLDDVCVPSGAAELFIPAGVAPPPLPSFPTPPAPVIPTPTPRPSPYPPATGPVPPNAREWMVTVVNDSAQPATLFLAEDDGSNTVDELCGSVSPNVVPAGVTQQVILLLPARNVRGCALLVNPVPGDPGSLFETSEVPMAGKVVITADGQIGWLGP